MTLQRLEPSRVSFAILIILIGLWGLAKPGFVAIWAPGVGPAILHQPIAIGFSLISIITGIGLLWPRFTTMAAGVLFAFLCLWLVWAKGLPLVRAPTAWSRGKALAKRRSSCRQPGPLRSGSLWIGQHRDAQPSLSKWVLASSTDSR